MKPVFAFLFLCYSFKNAMAQTPVADSLKFSCHHRGKITVKKKAEMDMYYVEGLRR